ncbi:alpha-tocopherol transfer protein-like [Lineus longissimus]|uniref:alpha-tocopherol transfer protein-like n=1 Tax=Lineus longissimus TaxID=88925 RepID=UPI002B4DFEC5
MAKCDEGDYVCALDSKLQDRARKELMEDPRERASQIESMRSWIKQQAHFHCRTDDRFLLRFLRAGKFSILRAQKILSNYLDVRTRLPEWFKDVDPRDHNMMKALDKGTIVPLGKDKEGRQVVLVRTGLYDENDFDDVMKNTYMTLDLLLADEANQINGFVLLVECGTFCASHATCWGTDTIRDYVSCWQDAYPIRNKGMHFYNMPTALSAVLGIFKMFMKEKIRDRMYNHANSPKSLHRYFPKSILPEEYDGTAGSLDEKIQSWKEYVLANRDAVIAMNECYLDESKMPKTLKSEEKLEADSWGMVGSFRKLNVE